MLVVVLMMSMLLAMTSTANANPKASWKAAKGTVKVDGKKDAIYKKAQTMKMAAVSDGDADGTKATAWAAYDSKALYFFVEVKDSKLDDTSANWYEKDQVEFRIDNKDQLVSLYAVTKKADTKMKGITSKIVKVKGGYNVEFKVPYKTKAGKAKFSLQVDAAAAGKRNCTYHTNADLANAWQDDTVFETLVLK